MLKLTPARDSVARYSFTGIVTRPNWMAPFHMERATAVPHAQARVPLAASGRRLYHRPAIAPPTLSPMRFRTILESSGKQAAGLHVPNEVIDGLGGGK